MRPSGRTVIVALLTALTFAPVWAGTPARQLPFRSTNRTVPVFATVTRENGSPVLNLEPWEFEVYDNGRKQRVTVFKNDVQPISIAILLDNSPSLFPVTRSVQECVIAFARLLRAEDRACLGTFSHVVTLRPELTNDVAALIKRIGDDAPFPAGTALWDAIDAGRAALSRENARRVILVVTDTMDNCSRADISSVRSALERDDVMLYVVGIRGREGLQRREMQAVSRGTGGWYYEINAGDNVAGTVVRIAEELHHQYALGFSPAVLDDKVHRIEVKLTRSGHDVRARRSYLASSGQAAR